MILSEFVNKIMLRFPPTLNNGDTLESYITDYINALNITGLYNFEDAFIELMRSYSFKTTPPVKIVIEILKRFEIKPIIKDEPEVWETLLVCKGKEIYEWAVKLANYKEHIEDFNRKGLSVIKLKFCKPERDCPHCNFGYAGVCMTAKKAI